jgi:hypothetical protein
LDVYAEPNRALPRTDWRAPPFGFDTRYPIGSSDGISQRVVRFHDDAEADAIAGVSVIWMVNRFRNLRWD